MHVLFAPSFWYWPVPQLSHDAWPVCTWYWPLPQSGHDPVPALPLGHAAQPVFPLLTAHPDPLLHDAWRGAPCHVEPAAHAPHSDLPALPCAHPAGQSLQDALPVPSTYSPASQLAHDPLPLWPAGHAAHDVLPLLTAHPAPLLHDAWRSAFCHWPPGHAEQPLAGVPEGRSLQAWLLAHELPAGQCGWCG